MILNSIFFLGMAFCEVNPSADPTETLKIQEQEALVLKIQKQITNWNKDLRCRSEKDCDSVALGARACGGPESFLVISRRNKNYKAMKVLANKHIKESEKLNQLKPGTMSICSIVTPTSVGCLNKKCQEIPD